MNDAAFYYGSTVGWTTADEWFADFLKRCQKQRPMRVRTLGQGFVPPPDEVSLRAYDEETAQRLAFIRGREQQAELADQMRRKAAKQDSRIPTTDRQMQIALAALGQEARGA